MRLAPIDPNESADSVDPQCSLHLSGPGDAGVRT
jgi:hypothetical protein